MDTHIMFLYHYSTELFDELKTKRSQETLSPEEIKQSEESAKKLQMPAPYIDHLSFFFDPISSVLLGEIFPKDHPAWGKGTHLYEYIIDTKSFEANVLFDVVEAPWKTEMMDKFPWGDEDDPKVFQEWLKVSNARKLELKERGRSRKMLDKCIERYQGQTAYYYKKASERDDWSQVNMKYAANVPHVMVYPQTGRVLPQYVNTLVIGKPGRTPVKIKKPLPPTSHW